MPSLTAHRLQATSYPVHVQDLAKLTSRAASPYPACSRSCLWPPGRLTNWAASSAHCPHLGTNANQTRKLHTLSHAALADPSILEDVGSTTSIRLMLGSCHPKRWPVMEILRLSAKQRALNSWKLATSSISCRCRYRRCGSDLIIVLESCAPCVWLAVISLSRLARRYMVFCSHLLPLS